MYQQIDKKTLQRHLECAKTTYANANFAQKNIASRLLSRLDLIKLQPTTALDLSLHPEDTRPLLQDQYPEAQIRAISDPDLLSRVEDSSLDLIVSNLFLQWFNNPNEIINHAFRMLKPNGLLFLTLPGPDTLQELRASFCSIDFPNAVHEFIDMHDVGDALLQSGFLDPVADVQRIELHYKRLSRLFLDLKETGSQNCRSDRFKGCVGKKRWQRLHAAYDRYKVSGKYPVTAEITFAHAWIPKNKFKNSFPGEFAVSVDSIRKVE